MSKSELFTINSGSGEPCVVRAASQHERDVSRCDPFYD